MNKQTTVKVMEITTDEDVQNLIKGLEKIKGFDFLIDVQFKIK